MSNQNKTVVVFRRWYGGDVLALFPYEKADVHSLYCMSYQHHGQHAHADYTGVISRTRPVKIDDPDVLDLVSELTRIGYDLQVKQRASYTKKLYAKAGDGKHNTP